MEPRGEELRVQADRLLRLCAVRDNNPEWFVKQPRLVAAYNAALADLAATLGYHPEHVQESFRTDSLPVSTLDEARLEIARLSRDLAEWKSIAMRQSQKVDNDEI